MSTRTWFVSHRGTLPRLFKRSLLMYNDLGRVGKGHHGPFLAQDMVDPKEENFVEVRKIQEGKEETGAEAVAEVPRRPSKNNESTTASIQHFSQAWHQVTENSFILNIVVNGYKIQFEEIPVQFYHVDRNMSVTNTAVCKNKVSELLKCKVIKVVSPSPGQYISHIFPVPKKCVGKFRIIFDLTS